MLLIFTIKNDFQSHNRLKLGRAGGFFFSKLINVHGKYQYTCCKVNVQGDFFLKNNKRANQNKAVKGGIFSQINKRACTGSRYTKVGSSEQTSSARLVP